MQAMSMADAIRQLGISEVTFYRWRKEYAGMSGDQLRRLKELEKLSYTAHDTAAFAREMGHVGADGALRRPFAWDEARRPSVRAKLDALFFQLYGITERGDVR